MGDKVEDPSAVRAEDMSSHFSLTQLGSDFGHCDSDFIFSLDRNRIFAGHKTDRRGVQLPLVHEITPPEFVCTLLHLVDWLS